MGWFPQSWERYTRIDHNGDGIIGSRGRTLSRYYSNPHAYNTSYFTANFEKWTGRDINGDGFVGNPHMVAAAHRTGQNPYTMPPGPYGPIVSPPPMYGGPVVMPPYNPGFWGYVGYGVGVIAAPFQVAGSLIGAGVGIVKGVVKSFGSAVKSVLKSL